MIKYIIINGYPCSGKSTFADMMVEYFDKHGYYATQFSTVDTVKHLALQMGWDGKKNDVGRKFLSDLKQLMVNSPTGNMVKKNVIRTAETFDMFNNTKSPAYVFLMCREPKEIQEYVETLGASAIFVRRDVPKDFSNDSDRNVENFSYHYYVDNNGTLEDLEKEVTKCADWILRCV